MTTRIDNAIYHILSHDPINHMTIRYKDHTVLLEHVEVVNAQIGVYINPEMFETLDATVSDYTLGSTFINPADIATETLDSVSTCSEPVLGHLDSVSIMNEHLTITGIIDVPECDNTCLESLSQRLKQRELILKLVELFIKESSVKKQDCTFKDILHEQGYNKVEALNIFFIQENKKTNSVQSYPIYSYENFLETQQIKNLTCSVIKLNCEQAREITSPSHDTDYVLAGEQHESFSLNTIFSTLMSWFD